ncbi:OsmC family protein [Peptococcaceae bacterium 1198_IL3148]
MPKVTVEWEGKMKFSATDESGHTITMDAPTAAGGDNTAPTPLSLILMSVAGCSGIDIVSILDKMKVKVEQFNIEVEGERVDDNPKVFKTVNVVYKLKGEHLPPDKVERAVKLSVDKYCSAVHIVNKTAQMKFTYEVNGERFALQ